MFFPDEAHKLYEIDVMGYNRHETKLTLDNWAADFT